MRRRSADETNTFLFFLFLYICLMLLSDGNIKSYLQLVYYVLLLF